LDERLFIVIDCPSLQSNNDDAKECWEDVMV